jgi:hypothetical protein
MSRILSPVPQSLRLPPVAVAQPTEFAGARLMHLYRRRDAVDRLIRSLEDYDRVSPATDSRKSRITKQ